MTYPNTFLGFSALCRDIDADLAPFQRFIARASFGPQRELAAILPRGSAKTTTSALLSLHHLLAVPDASVSLGAASREQAAIAFNIMRQFAEHPAIAEQVTIRHLALRTDGGALRVVSGRGERAHGATDSLALADEVWAWKDDRLLEAFQTGLIKRPDARLIMISTPAQTLDSPLGRQRTRAMAGEVEVVGSRIEATTPGLKWLEWSVPDGADTNDIREVKKANPAPWITLDSLRDQKERVTPQAWESFHCGRWGVSEGAWLPPGAWGACRADYEVEPGEEVWLGVDIGGSRAASAIVGVTADLRVAVVRVFQGNESVMAVTEAIHELAREFTIREIAYDPWRFKSEAIRLDGDGIGPMVEFPQSHSRMTVASERLHAVIAEGRLRHSGDAALDRHVASAIARATGRGWRLDKADHSLQIDAVVGLAMAVDRAEARVAPARLVGWV